MENLWSMNIKKWYLFLLCTASASTSMNGIIWTRFYNLRHLPQHDINSDPDSKPDATTADGLLVFRVLRLTFSSGIIFSHFSLTGSSWQGELPGILAEVRRTLFEGVAAGVTFVKTIYFFKKTWKTRWSRKKCSWLNDLCRRSEREKGKIDHRDKLVQER